MAIDVICAAGHSFKVKQAYAGRSGRCPHCGETVPVPVEATLRAIGAPSGEEKAGTSGSGSELLAVAAELAAAESNPSIACPVVKRLGRFELVEVVGTGGFGTVYRARDPQLDRDVALKVPRSGALADDADANRFLREAKASAQLRHPNIVAVYEAGQIDGTYFIAAGFVEGTTLRQAIKDRGAFPQREAAMLVAKLASALHYAHGKGIVHRDVKPANAMLDAAGEPLIMDFGLARRDEGDASRTMEGMILGTPAYMSPEQAQGRGHQADARSDLWSLGVILYELLTGQKPFSGGDTDVMIAVRVRDPDPPRKLDRTIPRDLETICLKCLAKSPAGRYATCQELADELERWLRGDPIQARRISPVERFGRWARRNPAVATLSTVAALLLLAVVGDQFAANRRLQQSQEQIRLALDEAQRATDEARAHAERAERFGREQKAALDKLRREEAARKRAEADAAAATRGQTEAQRDAALSDAAHKVEQMAREKAESNAAQSEEARTEAEKLADEQAKVVDQLAAERQAALLADNELEYVQRLSDAQLALDRGDNPAAEAHLTACPDEFRSWEWRHLHHRVAGDVSPVWGPSKFSSGGIGIKAIAFDANGNRAALCGHREVVVIDVSTGQILGRFTSEQQLGEACFASGFPGLFVQSYRALLLCNLESGAVSTKATINGNAVRKLLVAHGRPVVTTIRASLINLYDAETEATLARYRGESSATGPVAISPDQSTLAVGVRTGVSRGMSVRLVDLESKQDRLLETAVSLNGYQQSIQVAAFSPDSKEFLIVSNVPRLVEVWDVATGDPVPAANRDISWIGSLATGTVSTDGRRCAELSVQGNRAIGNNQTQTLVIWDVATGRDVCSLSIVPPDGSNGRAQSARFSPRGERLMVGFTNGIFAILEADDPAREP